MVARLLNLTIFVLLNTVWGIKYGDPNTKQTLQIF